MKPIHPDYPSLVKEVRRQLALSQEDPAWVRGVKYAAINRWEKGQTKPSKLDRAQLYAFCEQMQEAGQLDRSAL